MGYDISSEMIAEAKKQFAKSAKCQFFPSGQPVKHTYTVSSGIFNVMLDVPPGKWVEVIEQLLQTMYDASSTGFAFNMLNQPTDEIYRRDYLYYADPEYYETYCRKRFGKKSHSSFSQRTFRIHYSG